MKNFIFKSTDADLQKIITIIGSELNLLQKNLLYVTYRVDMILKKINDGKLQTQVDSYFNKDTEDIPEAEE